MNKTVLTLAVLVCVSACNRVENEGPRENAGATTPRTADGKPDVSGIWTAGGEGGFRQFVVEKENAIESHFESRTGGLYALEIDGHIMSKGNRNKPMYRPEYWDKVRFLQANVLQEDPAFRCLPDGVPRMGPPNEILRQANRLVFLYSNFNGAQVPKPFYRVIRLDRPHDPERVMQQTSRGDSVGRWEGDTLVVDTVGFNDETWLSNRLGYFHSVDLHVVERFTRTGDQMKYEVIVEDPTVLLEPWRWEPRMLVRDANPDAMLPEDYPCSERDAAYVPLKY